MLKKCMLIFLLSFATIGFTSPSFSYTQMVTENEECLDGAALLLWMRSPPAPLPSTELFLTLKGDQSHIFLILTAGDELATKERVLYFFRVPVEQPGKIFVAVADAQGCLIRLSGERTLEINLVAARTMPQRYVHEVLEQIGVMSAEPADYSI